MLLVARVLFFVQIIILAAALGAIAAFFGLILLGMLLGASTREGGLAMGAAGFMPVGALAGAALGAWLAWRWNRSLGRHTLLMGGYGLTGLAAVSVGGWFLVEELTDGDPYEDGREPVVLIEWWLPEKFPHARVDRVFRRSLRSSYQDWPLTTHWDKPRARDEGDRTILRMRATIRWRVTGRIFQLWRAPHHDTRITVDLGLPRDPKPSASYGPWQPVEGHPGHAFRWRVEVQ